MVQAGAMGLMEAMDRYDISRGIAFEAYCIPRVYGAIVDEMRSMDWVSHQVRADANKMIRIVNELECELGREPHDDEIAERTGMVPGDVRKIQGNIRALNTVSLYRELQGGPGRVLHESDVHVDERLSPPEAQAESNDFMEFAVQELTGRERAVILLRYVDGLTSKEVSVALGISEGRVSQIHSAVLDRLKTRLEYYSKEAA